MPRKSKTKTPKASKASKKTWFEPTVEPYVSLNQKTNILSVTAHPAFLRNKEGFIRSEDGSYTPRYAQPNRIIYALQDVTAPRDDGTDIWPRVQANDPEALSEVSKAIKATYRHDADWAERPYDEEVRGSLPFIIRTKEQEPRMLPSPETGLFKRIVSSSPPSNSARFRELPSARISARAHKTRAESKISGIFIVIDGTFATKHTGDNGTNDGEIRAMPTGSVDELAHRFSDLVSFLGPELVSLAGSNSRMPNYGRRHRETKEQFVELASDLTRQWVESVLEPHDIDHERVKGSVSTYTAKPVQPSVYEDLPPIQVNVVADYSRITGCGSVDEAEEDEEEDARR